MFCTPRTCTEHRHYNAMRHHRKTTMHSERARQQQRPAGSRSARPRNAALKQPVGRRMMSGTVSAYKCAVRTGVRQDAIGCMYHHVCQGHIKRLCSSVYSGVRVWRRQDRRARHGIFEQPTCYTRWREMTVDYIVGGRADCIDTAWSLLRCGAGWSGCAGRQASRVRSGRVGRVGVGAGPPGGWVPGCAASGGAAPAAAASRTREPEMGGGVCVYGGRTLRCGVRVGCVCGGVTVWACGGLGVCVDCWGAVGLACAG